MKTQLHRGASFDRIEYRPPPETCGCDNCREWNRIAKRRGDHRDQLALDRTLPCLYINREEVFARKWQEENDRRSLLDVLIRNGEVREVKLLRRGLADPIAESEVALLKLPVASARDRAIAATVIQWLGSNIGQAFLREALRECGSFVTNRLDLDTENAELRMENTRLRRRIKEAHAATRAAEDRYRMLAPVAVPELDDESLALARAAVYADDPSPPPLDVTEDQAGS